MDNPETLHQLEACKSLIEEHRTTEKLLDQLESRIQRVAEFNDITALDEARRLFHQLTLELNTHFACEEEGLFPVLSKYHPMVLMEVEHDELLELRKTLGTTLAEDSLDNTAKATLVEQCTVFLEELKNHIGREDHGIFPTAERALSELEKEEVIEKMTAVRSKAAVLPTPEITRPLKTFQPFNLDLNEPIEKNLNTRFVVEKGGLQMKTLTVKAGNALSPHWSPKQVILICLSGNAQWSTPGSSIPLKPGDGVVMDPRLSHSLQAHEDSRFLMVLSNPV